MKKIVKKGKNKFNPAMFEKTKGKVFGFSAIAKKKKRIAKKIDVKKEDLGKC
jgi:hypothetical protein